jgi:hypothetical protein
VRGWRPIAEDILGEEARIDFAGLEPTGRIVLVFVGEDDLGLIGRSLAQSAWVEARVPDWIQLAPALGIRPGAGVRSVLVCPNFANETRAAARAVGEHRIALAEMRGLRGEAPAGIDLGAAAATTPIPVSPNPVPAFSVSRIDGPDPHGASPDPVPTFRTGLTDADLGLSADEHADLDGS